MGGREHSGVDGCFMCHRTDETTENTMDNRRWKRVVGKEWIRGYVCRHPRGNNSSFFCTRKEGTSVNDKDYCVIDPLVREAGRGDCPRQFQVNDLQQAQPYRGRCHLRLSGRR